MLIAVGGLITWVWDSKRWIRDVLLSWGGGGLKMRAGSDNGGDTRDPEPGRVDASAGLGFGQLSTPSATLSDSRSHTILGMPSREGTQTARNSVRQRPTPAPTRNTQLLTTPYETEPSPIPIHFTLPLSISLILIFLFFIATITLVIVKSTVHDSPRAFQVSSNIWVAGE